MKPMDWRYSLLFIAAQLSFAQAFALPFTITPTTPLPTAMIPGETVNALYTVKNNSSSARANNYVKYLPPFVTQVLQDNTYPDLCGATFNLQPANTNGDSCTLELQISGPVYALDPNPHHHLFVCYPGGTTCAGTLSPLNVSESTIVAAGLYARDSYNRDGGLIATSATGDTWKLQPVDQINGNTVGGFIGASCVGQNCVILGSFGSLNANNGYPAIGTSNDGGNSWAFQTLTLPPSYLYGAGLGVNCADTRCIGGATYTNQSQENLAGILLSNDLGNTWSQTVLPLINGVVLAQTNSALCSASTCIAVGLGYNGINSLPLIATSSDDGQNWSQQLLPIPNGFTSGFAFGVAKSNSTYVAAGSYDDGTNLHPGIARSTDGTTWSQQVLNIPNGFSEGEFRGISCTSTYCIAVGYYDNNNAYATYPAIARSTDNGNTWTQQALNQPSGGYYNSQLYGVNCQGTRCVAAGAFEKTHAANPGIAVSNDSGLTWQIQTFSNYPAAALGGVG
jgi:photosystem II stability/assembly factor-like uncharacterized protein